MSNKTLTCDSNEIHKVIDELTKKGVKFQIIINVNSETEKLAESEKPTTTNLYKEISIFLHELGIPAHLKGYHYLRDGILTGIKNPKILESMTKVVYPNLAELYGTTPSRVERAMRHSIKVCWDRGNPEMLNKIFGYSVDNNRGNPTNSEFIAMIVDKFLLKYPDEVV